MSLRYSLFSAALVLAVACNKNDTPRSDAQTLPASPQATAIPNANPSPQEPSVAGPVDTAASNQNTGASHPEALTDEQIAKITDDANSAEIDQAKLAESRAKDPRVKSFAERMIKHHGEAKDKQAQLKLKTDGSTTSRKLENDATVTLATLKGDQDPAFDRDYIADQVSEHQQVLDMINDQLLPNVKNADLKSYLNELKPKVQMHLMAAQDLQRKLSGETARNESQ